MHMRVLTSIDYKHVYVCVCIFVCYHAVGLYVGSLQCNGDTIKEDKEEDDMIEHLVTYDSLTPLPEPEKKEGDRVLCQLLLCFCIYHTSSTSFPPQSLCFHLAKCN